MTAWGRIRGQALTRALGTVSWLAGHLPERPLVVAAEVTGDAWYRLAPKRAARARRNLQRVAEWAAAEQVGSAALRRAATEPAALERFVRSAFRRGTAPPRRSNGIPWRWVTEVTCASRSNALGAIRTSTS